MAISPIDPVEPHVLAKPSSTDLAGSDLGEGLARRRAASWASTMAGFEERSEIAAIRLAHRESNASFATRAPISREEREIEQDAILVPGATRARGSGNRALDEEPDAFRTCFERDRDRILHSFAFRRLAGKTQVFIFPTDHQRTRLTHALEVAQVARSIAEALQLNVALAEAIALGHDCGHGPGGHASEDALAPYLVDGYDHAVFGADVVMAPLNLTAEVLDGIRNHSWSRPAPSTPEGEVVSWADRIAYLCHDFEDAVHAAVVSVDSLPDLVRERCGTTRGAQLGTFITAVVDASRRAGRVGMTPEYADALGEFRKFNYDAIYLRPDSVAQARSVVEVLRALVEHLIVHPEEIPGEPRAVEIDLVRAAVGHVAGMTDRYAFELATTRLGYPPERLPRGVDLSLRPSH